MLTLLLLRHAKSSWDHPGVDDFERPLAERGRQAAPLLGHYIAEHGLEPDLILCSSAVRTQQTLEIVKSCFKGEAPALRFEDDLYMATASQMVERLKRVPQRWKRVMVVGHNPGLGDLARLLPGSGEAEQMRSLAEKYPTAGLAVITFEAGHWSDIASNKGKLRSFVTPRSLKR